jgi:hypothetical protein
MTFIGVNGEICAFAGSKPIRQTQNIQTISDNLRLNCLGSGIGSIGSRNHSSETKSDAIIGFGGNVLMVVPEETPI